MKLPPWFAKKIPPVLAYPLLVVFSVVIFSLSLVAFGQRIVEAQLQAIMAPFDGYITNIEYNCLCSLGVKLTITPITQTSRTNWGNSYDLMFYYGPQLFEELGIELFDVIPRLYPWYNIWYAGDQKLLGNAIRGSFPCVAVIPSPPYCEIESYGQGAITIVGTSLY